MSNQSELTRALDEAVALCESAWREQFGRPPTVNELYQAWETVLKASAEDLCTDPETFDALAQEPQPWLPLIDELTLEIEERPWWGFDRAQLKHQSGRTLGTLVFVDAGETLFVDYTLDCPCHPAQHTLVVEAVHRFAARAYCEHAQTLVEQVTVRSRTFLEEPETRVVDLDDL